MSILVSFIVPAYNQERYIGQCLKSIAKQGLKPTDFEIIVVNDGSTDNTLEICENFAKKAKNFARIIDVPNGGVELARHIGYQHAQGKYIMHVDSDDWLEEEIVCKMLAISQEKDVDYIECATQRVIGNRFLSFKSARKSPIAGLIAQPDLFDKYFISFFGINILSVSLWGKLYKKETLDKACLRPSGYTMGEDLIYNLKLFPQLDSIYIMDEIGYNYRWGGMTSKFNPKLYSNLKGIYSYKMEMASRLNYTKAFAPCRIELKNILKSEIQQRIIWKYEPAESTIEFISQELADPIWKDIIETMNSSEHFIDTFSQSLLNKDSKAAYQSCYEQVMHNKWKRNIKRCALELLSKLC